MLPSLEVRQLHALVLLAEEMNLTRAANRLNVSQPALSKLVTELEEQYGLHLFNREKGRLIELTDAGQIFIEEARAALSHAERAIQLARAAQEGIERILMVGHSPHCDQAWISTVVGIRLPLYPRLRIRLMGQYPTELVRSVVTAELNFALVTAPSLTPTSQRSLLLRHRYMPLCPRIIPPPRTETSNSKTWRKTNGSYFRNGCIRLFMTG